MTNTKNKNEVKNLLTDNCKALQFAHDFAGFDLCAPFTLRETREVPTIIRIKNLLNLETVKDMNILIFIKPYNHSIVKRNQLNVAIVDNEKIVPIVKDWRLNTKLFCNNIEYFWTVREYTEEKRKTAQKFYILAQNKKHQTTPTKTTEQLTTYTRYKITKHGYDNFYIVPTDKNKIEPLKIYCSLTTFDTIDKSGYLKSLAIDNLEQRAEKLRQRRKQNEYKTLNKTEHINTVKGIINYITNAMTFKATQRDSKLIDETLRTLKKARAFLKNIKNNKYTDITSFQEDYDTIIQAFGDIQETRNSGKKWYVCTVYKWHYSNKPQKPKTEESTKKEYAETLKLYSEPYHADKYKITIHESRNKQNKLLLVIEK